MRQEPLTSTLRETLVAFGDRGAPRTTTEVAEELDLGRRTTYGRLDRLVQRGVLETKKVGANARVWWRPPESGDPSREGYGPDESLLGDVLDRADVGVVVLDDESDVAWVSETTERYFGLDRGRVVGLSEERLVEEWLAPATEEPAALAEAVLESQSDGDADRVECHVRPGEDRRERWVERRSEPIEDGAYAGGRVELYYDVTDRVRSELVHSQDRSVFASLVDAVDEYAIFMLDPEGYVRTWNPGAERIKGYDADEIIGEHVSTFYTEADRADGVPDANLATASAEGTLEEEGWRVRADGSRFWAAVTITPVRDEEGTLDGYAKVTRDMTERRETERALRRERNLLEETLETSQVGIGIFGPDGDAKRVNDRFTDLLELPGTDPSDYSLGDQPLLDGDGEVIPFPQRPAPTALSTGEPVVDRRIRVDGDDGTTRWLSVNATPIDGEYASVVVTMADVTELERQTRRLERQRDDLEAELDDVFDRIDDGVMGVDEDWRVTHLNDSGEALLGVTEVELVGRRLPEEFPDATDGPYREQFERAMETQEPVTFEEYLESADGWLEVTVYPSETGLSVYFRDVTERKRRERELVQFETLFEESKDVNVVVDGDGTFQYVTPSAANVFGYEPAQLVGESGFEYVHPDDRERAMAEFAETIRTPSYEPRIEFRFERADGSWIVLEGLARDLRDDPDIGGIVVYTRDVTERKRRERELERSETLLETLWDGVYALDDDERFVYVNEAFCDLVGYDREQLLGEHMTLLDRQGIDDAAKELEAAVLDGDREVGVLEYEFETADGETVPVESRFGPYEYGEGRYGRCGVARDVSQRKDRERALEERLTQQEVVAELGQRALDDGDLDDLMADAATLVADTLNNDYCKVLDLDAQREELLLRRGVGWDDGIVGSATVSAVEDDSQAAYTLASSEPVRVNDLQTESRFSGPELLTSHDVRSGISVVIGPQEDPWGILGTHDTDPKSFGDHDVNFVQSVANILATAIERREHEGRLLRQRQQLAALNNVNRVVREITDAVIDESSREEIEATVCERLAAVDSYAFAWVGEVDVPSRTVEVRTEAGVEGYLDDITISVDPEDERSEGATGRAIRTGEIQTTQDVRVDDRYEPWRGVADEHGFKSSAAIPIVHDGTTYGVLNVYAERPDAFEGPERAVVGQLGEVVGHAIAAAERERALLGDEVVELEFHVRDLLADVGVDEVPDEPITFENAVPIGDGQYLLFGTTSPEAVPTVEALTEASSYWEAVSFEHDEDVTEFRVRLADPPTFRALSARGGTLAGGTIAYGDFDVTMRVPPGGDVRGIIDAVQEAYPGAELLRRTQYTREREDPRRFQDCLVSDLTDRQRTALETAYRAGFFEWPRVASGEDVADSIGVSPPTFHQHLRKAERKMFDAVFSAPDPA